MSSYHLDTQTRQSIEDYILAKQRLDRLCLEVKEAKKNITDKEKTILPLLRNMDEKQINLEFNGSDIDTYGCPNLRLYIQEDKRRSSVTMVLIITCIRKFMQQKFPKTTPVQLDHVSQEMAKYIWDARGQTTTPRLICKSDKTIMMDT